MKILLKVAIALVKDGVVEARVDVHLLDGRRQAVEEAPLRGELDHPVRAGAEHERWRVDGAGIEQQPG